MIAFGSTAQTFMDNVRAEIQAKIQHLNPNDVPTRILYDRTLPVSNLLGYGTPSGFAPLASWSNNGSTLNFEFMNKNFNSIIDFRFTITDECGNPQYTPVRFTILEDGGRPQPMEDFVVHPVPAKDMITITNTQSETPAIDAVLYDMFGQEKTAGRTKGNNSIVLDVSDIPDGIYILKIMGNNGIQATKHISIER